MRISPDFTPDILAALASTRQQEQQALQEISSGRRVTEPSDDPAAFAAYVQNRSRYCETDDFLYSISTVRGLLQAGDSTLSSVITNLEHAISLGIEGASGTTSKSQREAIAHELRGIQQNLVTLANTSFRGSPVFSGTSSNVPFTFDPVSGAVQYVGNSTVNEICVGNGRTVKSNIPGDQLFLDDEASVFGSIQQLINSLDNNASTAEIGDATGAVRSAFDHVTARRSFFGNALNHLEANESYLKNAQLQLAAEENRLVGTSQEESITRFVNAQTARDMTLAATARISNLSLLDYLE